MTRVCAFALLALSVVAVPASAAEVEAGGVVTTYLAAPGEANRLTVSRVDRHTLAFRDEGATVRAGPGCVAVGEGEARCTVERRRTSIVVDVGDGDDTVLAPMGVSVEGGDGEDTLAGCWLSGGAGNDVLQGCSAGAWLGGSDGDDELRGGDGRDTLGGGRGRDRLLGGGGDDALSGDDATSAFITADELDGGDGRDRVTYALRGFPVTVNLADPGPDGEAGEGDVLRAIESVVGGSGDDTLVGTDGPNALHGGPGADTIDAGGGDDLLTGGPGADELRGGDGEDELQTRDLFLDRAGCGSGDDVLLREPGDPHASGCERTITRRFELVPARFSVPRSGPATVRLACPMRHLSFGICTATLTVDLIVGHRRIRAGQATCVDDFYCPNEFQVAFSRRARAALARHGRLPARLTFVRGSSGPGALQHVERATVTSSRVP